MHLYQFKKKKLFIYKFMKLIFFIIFIILIYLKQNEKINIDKKY